MFTKVGEYITKVLPMRPLFFLTSFIITCLLPMMSCKSQQKVFNPEEEKEECIVFGNGGGFTGAVKEYAISKNGNIYLKSNDKYEKIGSFPKSKATQILENFYSMELDKMTLDEPGNRYYYIKSRQNNQSQSLKWGKNPLTDKNLDLYYNLLMQIVKKYSSQ